MGSKKLEVRSQTLVVRSKNLEVISHEVRSKKLEVGS